MNQNALGPVGADKGSVF